MLFPKELESLFPLDFQYEADGWLWVKLFMKLSADFVCLKVWAHTSTFPLRWRRTMVGQQRYKQCNATGFWFKKAHWNYEQGIMSQHTFSDNGQPLEPPVIVTLSTRVLPTAKLACLCTSLLFSLLHPRKGGAKAPFNPLPSVWFQFCCCCMCFSSSSGG